MGNVGSHDVTWTQSDSETSNDMSYENACAIAWKGCKAGKGTGKKGSNGPGVWHREKKGVAGKEMMEARKEARRGPRAVNLIGALTRTKEALETKAKGKGKGKGKSETRSILRRAGTYWSELSIQVDQQHRRRRGPRLVRKGRRARELGGT